MLPHKGEETRARSPACLAPPGTARGQLLGASPFRSPPRGASNPVPLFRLLLCGDPLYTPDGFTSPQRVPRAPCPCHSRFNCAVLSACPSPSDCPRRVLLGATLASNPSLDTEQVLRKLAR